MIVDANHHVTTMHGGQWPTSAAGSPLPLI
jgi:hypothetical protein